VRGRLVRTEADDPVSFAAILSIPSVEKPLMQSLTLRPFASFAPFALSR
jgi:hypothetical protein